MKGFLRKLTLIACLAPCIYAANEWGPGNGSAAQENPSAGNSGISRKERQTVQSPEFQVPPSLGNVRSSFIPESGEADGGPVVFLIEANHRVYTVQERIRRIIDFITEAAPEKFFVGLEGGVGSIDPTVFRVFPDAEARARVVDEYLESGELTGAESSSILSPREEIYYGLEDSKVYEENRTALLGCFRVQARVSEELDLASDAITVIKQQVWPANLRRLDIDYDKYREGQLTLDKFMKYLMGVVKKKKIQIAYYPAIDAHFVRLNYEKEFNEGYWRDLAEKFIWEFKDRVQKSLDPKDIAEYEWQFETYRRGIYKRLVFTSYLMRKAKECRLDIAEFDPLEREIQRAERVSLDTGGELEPELEKLVSDLKEILAATEDDQTLLELDRNFEILRHMADLNASHEELSIYRATRDRFSSGYFLTFVKKHYPPGRFKWELSPFERFYELAEKRDLILYNNLMKEAGALNLQKRILVAGAFHADGIKELFRKNGVAYVAIDPRTPEKILDKASRLILEGRVSYRQWVKGKETFEAPLAMTDPKYRKDFYQAATEKMTLDHFSRMTRPEYSGIEAFLGQWKKAYEAAEALRKGEPADQGCILRLYDVLKKKTAA